MSLIKVIKSGRNDKIVRKLIDEYDPAQREPKTQRNILHLCVEYEADKYLEEILERPPANYKFDLNEKDTFGDVF